MPFDQSQVISVAAPVYGAGSQVYISWTPATAGLLWQVYVNAALAVETNKTGVWLAVPTAGVGRVDIGAILPSEAGADFSASLPAAPKRRASIAWSGGTSLGLDLSGFHVYWGGSPGTAVSYATPIADITAFPGGSTAISGSYSWQSAALVSGTYHFGVRPYDVAGNEGTAQEITVIINAPPGAPAKFADGSRLHYSLVPGGTTPSVALNWNASEFG